MPDPSPNPSSTEREPRDFSLAAVELTGSLSCLRCGYDLRGLSVVGQCPECALKVRASLLARVDPYAHELQPIRLRWLVAFGVVLGPAAALLTAILIWVHRICDIITTLTDMTITLPWGPAGVATCIGASGVGCLALVRPHRMHSRRSVVLALGAVLLFVPLAWIMHEVVAGDIGQINRPYLSPAPMSPTRVAMCLGSLALAALILLGLRQHHQGLIARSKLMRSGVVARQSLAAIILAIAVAAAGYVLLYLSGGTGTPGHGFLRPTSTFVVAAGFMLLTVGLVELVLDSIRLWSVIVMPPLSPQDVLSRAARSGGRANDSR